MRVLDGGAPAVWPKILTCRNCGDAVLVESLKDMATLPGFTWLPQVAPQAFQFTCRNACGNAFACVHPATRQMFHHAPSVLFGGSDVTEASPGAQQIDPKVRRFRQAPKRRRKGGDAHGTIPVA